jgi:hypothetical protein
MNVYELMAVAGPIVEQEVREVGTAPHRKYIACITYANGLEVAYAGEQRGFYVVKGATK